MTSRPAFTLIELLVVTAIFSVVFLIGASVYTSGFTKQKKVQSQQRVTAEARYILETIARTIRVGTVDYAFYTTACSGGPCDLSQAQSLLALRDETNTPVCFALDAGRLVTTATCTQPTSTWSVVTPTDLQTSALSIWINPAADPFLALPTKNADCKVNPPVGVTGYQSTIGVCGCAVDADCFTGQTCSAAAGSTTLSCRNPNVQPMVTAVLTMGTLPGAQFPSSTTLQTSTVSRIYRR